MTCVMPPRSAVLLPGTGSDEVFVRSVFAEPLARVGITTYAVPPCSGADVVRGGLARLDALVTECAGPVLVGGVSLGAHLAVEWALRHPGRCVGVLAALPAWSGTPAGAPAAVAATASADLVSRVGLDAALRLSTDGVPRWLAAELRRAWRRHGAGLADSLRAAASHPAPGLAELRTLATPVGIAACRDDPVHPAAVARRWAEALPRAAVRETSLEALGADPGALGRAVLSAWWRVSPWSRRTRRVRSC